LRGSGGQFRARGASRPDGRSGASLSRARRFALGRRADGGPRPGDRGRARPPEREALRRRRCGLSPGGPPLQGREGVPGGRAVGSLGARGPQSARGDPDAARAGAERLMAAIQAYGLTDVGRKRKHNEDAFAMDVTEGLFIVADGMGGHAAGEVASKITVETIGEFIAATRQKEEATWPFKYNHELDFNSNRLAVAIEKANERVMAAVAAQ